MRKLVYDRNTIKDYKAFYEDIVKKLDADRFVDWQGETNLNYNANNLSEFLWYCHKDNVEFVFLNFDLDQIENYKTTENYEWNNIFSVIKKFTTQYANNAITFVNV